MHNNGFTLLETLVALIVLNILMIGTIHHARYTLSAIRKTHVELIAEQSLENKRELT